MDLPEGRRRPTGSAMALVVTTAVALGGIAAGCGSGDAAGEGVEPAGTATSRTAGGAGASQVAPGEATAAAKRSVRLVRIGTFQEPLYVTAPPGDTSRVFVVQKGGRILVVEGGKKLSRPFLDLSSEVSTGEEQGLLSMAFAPDYETSGKFYVDFTDGDGDTRIQEFERSQQSPDRANGATRRELLKIDQPYENHNGGQLQFGPDGLLYIGMGDGGSGNDPNDNAQDLGSLLGKLLRIDPKAQGGRDYGIPEGNPFTGRSGARDEIYAYGLRNPWRFSFDRSTGDIVIGDVGQDRYEEIDFRKKGGASGLNFGWPAYEGRARNRTDVSAPGATRPVYVYQLHAEHASAGEDNCSITGGYVVRDRGVPGLYGRYVFGDYCAAWIRSAKLSSGKARQVRKLSVKVAGLSSFGEDARGRIYATSLEGPVYRLAAGR